jgi:thioredoxin-dependent peroxiredoxin
MVSLDDPDKNAEFAASLDASLPVISDPDGVVAKKYGVLALGGFYARRWTFYIDIDGRVRKIDKDVSTSTAGSDIVRTLGELGFPKRDESGSPQP